MRVSPVVAQWQVPDWEKVEEATPAAMAVWERSALLLARVVSPRSSRTGLRLFAPEQPRAIVAIPAPPLRPVS